jgi:hypothetical protein
LAIVARNHGRLRKCTHYFAAAVLDHDPVEFHTARPPLIETISNPSEQIRNYDRGIEALAKRYPARCSTSAAGNRRLSRSLPKR